MENINKESFEQLYNRLYNENFNELEEIRKKNAKAIKKVLTIVGIILGSFLLFEILSAIGIINIGRNDSITDSQVLFIVAFAFSVPVLVIIIAIITIVILKVPKKQVADSKENNENVSYMDIFKQKVISPIIKNVLVNSEYYYNVGLTKEEYNEGAWERYDRYDSEDKIVTDINIGENKEIKSKLIMSEIHTQDRRRDSDGDTHYVTMFHGLAGYIKLPKDIGCYLKVVKNQFNLFGFSNDKLEMDMTEFEKMFDVETDDKIKAMQILTVDIMNELIELVNASKVRFEFYINHDMMHIRFHTGEVFEPVIFGKSMQLERLKKYFDIVTSIKNITEHICNITINTEL